MFYVYLLASKPYGTLYLGVTSNLARRVSEHKNKLVSGFTKRHGVDYLVWFESHDFSRSSDRPREADKRMEERLEINLIERDNPHWIDLYPSLSAGP